VARNRPNPSLHLACASMFWDADIPDATCIQGVALAPVRGPVFHVAIDTADLMRSETLGCKSKGPATLHAIGTCCMLQRSG